MPVVYMVRHGQATFGPGDYDNLTELGREQADLAGRELGRRLSSIDVIAHGDLRRQRDTATACAQALHFVEPTREHVGLNEFDHEDIILALKPAYKRRAVMFADLAKTLNPRQAFQEVFDKAVDRWTAGENDADYNETAAQFTARVLTAFDELVQEADDNVVLGTSGGVISAICANLLGGGHELWTNLNRVTMNAAITKVVVGKRGRSVVTFNDTGHLERAGREFLTYR
jgi:broad specificity phosphatase PhoE